MATTPAISIAGLTRHYPGVRALTDLTLGVGAGTIHGFLGPNGAGKTTALRILAGLVRPDRGTATIAGIPLEAGAAYRLNVGYLAQEPRFYPWLTGRETLAFVRSLYPTASLPPASWLAEILDIVGLRDAGDRRTGTYSGGMRQRLGIAQAMVAQPAVLLLDEPVSALDPVGRHEVLDLLASIRGATTVFYSTHILDDVQRLSDHVSILDHGRLVRSAPTAELLTSYTQDRMHVVLAGARDDTAVQLARIPGVLTVEPVSRDGGTSAYRLRIHPDAASAVQRSVARMAAALDLTLIQNDLVRLDLEDVFLRLIDPLERAA